MPAASTALRSCISPQLSARGGRPQRLDEVARLATQVGLPLLQHPHRRHERPVRALARLLHLVDAAVEPLQGCLDGRHELVDGLLPLFQRAFGALLVLAERLLREVEEHLVVGLQRLARERFERRPQRCFRLVEQCKLLRCRPSLRFELLGKRRVGRRERARFCDAGFQRNGGVVQGALQARDVAFTRVHALDQLRTVLGSRRDAALEARTGLRAGIHDGEDTEDDNRGTDDEDGFHCRLLVALQPARAMADRSNMAIGRKYCIETAQGIESAAVDRQCARKSLRGRAVEHEDHGAAMVIMLGAEVEKRLDGGGRNAALLRANGSVAGEAGVHGRSPSGGHATDDAHGGGSCGELGTANESSDGANGTLARPI
jgi:hypothetical protein